MEEHIAPESEGCSSTKCYNHGTTWDHMEHREGRRQGGREGGGSYPVRILQADGGNNPGFRVGAVQRRGGDAVGVERGWTGSDAPGTMRGHGKGAEGSSCFAFQETETQLGSTAGGEGGVPQ